MSSYEDDQLDYGPEHRLVSSSESDGDIKRPQSVRRTWKTSGPFRIVVVLAVMGWAALASLLAYILVYPNASCSWIFPTPVYSPANDLLEYELMTFSSGYREDTKKYMAYGKPSPQLDDNWLKLYQKVVEVTPEMQAHGFDDNTTPNNADENPEWHSIYVFHQLHCVNMLRMSLYPEYYDRAKDPLLHVLHLEHCIETMRRSVMCNSDVTPFSFRYVNNTQEAREWDRAPHVCRKFDRIHKWAKDLPGIWLPSVGELPRKQSRIMSACIWKENRNRN
ncbi:hypothetical protein PG987_016504 [Apiospora arundinis]